MDSATPDRGVDLLRRFPNRGPVLVDEAHNFRNINQRSRGLCNYLEAGDHKVVLLSATLQNLGPMDNYRQLTLFLDDTDHGLNLDPVSLEAYFGTAQRWMEYRVDYENYDAEYQGWGNGRPRTAPPLPPTQPAVPRADIPPNGVHYRFYQAPGAVCRACPAFGVCTKSKDGRNVTVGPNDAALRRHRTWMATSAATEVYKLRKQVVEPVFGIIKEQQGGRRFLLRSLLNVAAEWTVLATAFNLRTLCRVWRSRIFDQVFGRSPCPSPWPPEPHHAW